MNEQRDLPFWHVCAVVVLFCVAYLVASSDGAGDAMIDAIIECFAVISLCVLLNYAAYLVGEMLKMLIL